MTWKSSILFVAAFAAASLGYGVKTLPAGDEPAAKTPSSIQGGPRPASKADPAWLIVDASHDRSLSDLLHLMRLFGPQAELRVRAGGDRGTEEGGGKTERVRLLSAVLDSDSMRVALGSVSLRTTPYGARYFSADRLPKPQATAGEAHRDQVLATLAQLSIPIDEEIRIGGRHLSLRVVLDDSMMTFSILQEELPWTAIAYSHYLAAKGKWTNKFGETFTLDDLAMELMSRPLAKGSCGGIHTLQALTAIRGARHAGMSVVRPKVAAEIDGYIGKYATLALRRLIPQQGWGPKWFDPDAPARESSDLDYVLITGHMLEWMLNLPEPLRLDHESAEQTSRALELRLDTVRGQAHVVPICPFTHAILAVAGWSKS